MDTKVKEVIKSAREISHTPYECLDLVLRAGDCARAYIAAAGTSEANRELMNEVFGPITTDAQE